MLGAPGAEQFRDAIVEMRNLHIAAGLAPLMLLREEVVTCDQLRDRGGMDDATRDHFIQLLINCDKWRRRVTYNPEGADLKSLLAEATDTAKTMDGGGAPFAGDDIQMGSGGLYQLPWHFDGTDPNVPLNSALNFSNGNANIMLGAIDRAVVAWTRLNSRDRTQFITKQDSLRIYGQYQMVLEYLNVFGGDENRVDVAQVRATDEPRGPGNAANRLTESVGGSGK